MTAPVRLDSVRKTYGGGEGAVTALAGITVEFPAATFTAVMGPSGSGKSTLLHCAAGLDEPDSGTVTLVGTELTGLSETDLTVLRRDHGSFVFQSFNLMPALDVRANVTLPSILAGRTPDRAWVAEVISRVGLGNRVGHRPAELSGGQQQRVAIARALALMRSLVGAGQTIVMVTHDPVAASYADTVLFLVDGQIVNQLARPTARLAQLRSAADPAVRGQR